MENFSFCIITNWKWGMNAKRLSMSLLVRWFSCSTHIWFSRISYYVDMRAFVVCILAFTSSGREFNFIFLIAIGAGGFFDIFPLLYSIFDNAHWAKLFILDLVVRYRGLIRNFLEFLFFWVFLRETTRLFWRVSTISVARASTRGIAAIYRYR